MGITSLADRSLRNGKRKMTEIFVKLASDGLRDSYAPILNMQYQEAVEEFKRTYFKQQYIESGKN